MELWNSLRDSLKRDLQMDDEWVSESPQTLEWWGSGFKTQVAADELEDRHGLGDLAVTVTTDLVQCDGSTAADLISSSTPFYPFGLFVQGGDGVIRLMTRIQVNMISIQIWKLWLRDVVLVQSAYAAMVAKSWEEQQSGVTAARSEHPVSGLRESPDEMVSIYRDGRLRLPTTVDVAGAYSTLQYRMNESLEAAGYELFHDEGGLRWYSAPMGVVVFCGMVTSDELAEAFGNSFIVRAMITPPKESWTHGEIREAADALEQDIASPMIGCVPFSTGSSTFVQTMIPYPALAALSQNSFMFAMGLSEVVQATVAQAHRLKLAKR